MPILNKIGVFAPSDSIFLWKERFLRGVKYFNQNGIEIIESKCLFSNITNQKEKADNLNKLVGSGVDMIILANGGYTSNLIVDYIDYDYLKKSCIPIMGFSDCTTFLLSIHKVSKLPVFYGPNFITSYCEYPRVNIFTNKEIKTLFNENVLTLKRPTRFSKENIDWSEHKSKKYLKSPNTKFFAPKKMTIKGISLAFNISTIWKLFGTKYEPIFYSRILFMEDFQLPVNEFISFLKFLEMQGVFGYILAIVISINSIEYYTKELIIVLNNYRINYDIGIVLDYHFGHTEPKSIIPIGSEVIIDFKNKNISIKNTFIELLKTKQFS